LEFSAFPFVPFCNKEVNYIFSNSVDIIFQTIDLGFEFLENSFLVFLLLVSDKDVASVAIGMDEIVINNHLIGCFER
jgi:hypothetical protein